MSENTVTSFAHPEFQYDNLTTLPFYSMKVELAETKERSLVMGGRYKQNQQLEELRHLQDRMAHEKRAWQLEREAAEQEMETKKRELLRTQVSSQMQQIRIS